MKQDYAEVNGIRMYYEIHGEEHGGLPLVLIHGGGSTIESTFRTVLPLLAQAHKVVALELQAHGRTSDRDAPESFEQDADDVAGLLKHLGITKANILGFSNGGTTTLQFAIRHLGLTYRIIVISANYQREGMVPGFFEGMPNATLNDMPADLQKDFLKVNPDKNLLKIMFEKDRNRMIHFKDIEDRLLQSIRVPVLLISGDHDVVLPEHILKMSRVIPNAQLVILPGTHGAFMVAKPGSRLPEITVDLIEEFLRE